VTGPLDGLRVVELSHELVAWAGKLLADLGADVVVVEPPGGSHQRAWGPFVDDVPDVERSLWWWHYNTSKRGIEATLDDPALAALVRDADVFLVAEPVERLAAARLDWPNVAATNASLVMTSVRPFGRTSERDGEPCTDLTILAQGGPVSATGYDDHTLPPVRGGGNQGFHTASHFAVLATMTALVARDVIGTGQLVDVSAHAAANVTTEVSTYGYLATGYEVVRQTGRHAGHTLSLPTQFPCADGRYVNAGLVPRKGSDFSAMLAWLDGLGLRDEFPLSGLLEIGTAWGIVPVSDILNDALTQEVYAASREAQQFVAQRIGAHEYFTSSQRHGLTAGIVYAPEELLDDPHFVARGWPTPVEHDDIGRTVTYPGQPYRFTATPWAISRRAPHLGEHQSLLATGWD
jgi:crotonobetainyl-CoA:carnitine CoA-transferase CaiB-like acyl-CoA transferase